MHGRRALHSSTCQSLNVLPWTADNPPQLVESIGPMNDYRPRDEVGTVLGGPLEWEPDIESNIVRRLSDSPSIRPYNKIFQTNYC